MNVALALVLLVSAGMTYYHLGLFIPHALERRASRGLGGGYSFGDDFYPIWLTSRQALLGHRDLYASEMTREIQIGLFGRPLDPAIPTDPPVTYRAFAYPAYTNLLFWPLALLPFPVVRILLSIVLAALTAYSVFLWLRALRISAHWKMLAIVIILTLSSYAVLEGLFASQPGLIVGFLLAASFAELVKGRLFRAGSLYAFTLIKPQMSGLLALYLLIWSFSDWRHRRRFVFGLLAWTALLMCASLLVWPHWIPQWIDVLSGYGYYSPPALLTYSLGAKYGARLGPPLIVVLIVAALIMAVKIRQQAATSPLFQLTASLLLAFTSITLLPGQAVYDHVVLLPGILLIAHNWRSLAASRRPFRVALVAAALALFWQWIAAILLIAVRYFLAPAIFFSNAVLLLPLRAAASVPLAVSAMLGFWVAKALRRNRVDAPPAARLTSARSS